MVEPKIFLAVDVGRAYTRVALIKSIDGEYRLVAAGKSISAGFGLPDVMASVRSAMREIKVRTGHRLLTDDGQMLLAHAGVSIVASAAPPLRVAVIGLTRDIGVATALRALKATNAIVVAALALDDTDNLGDTLIAADPEVIVLVGGIDGGATTRLFDLADLIAALLAPRDERARPMIVFAGNSNARAQVAARIGQVATCRMADNVRPSLERENLGSLQSELQTQYLERKVKWLPGLSMLASQANATIIPAAQAFENVVQYLARRYAINVLGADVGASTTTLVSVRDESHTRWVCPNLGVGGGLKNLIEQTGIPQLLSWLPMEMDVSDVQEFYLNHALRPTTLPTTREEMWLIQSAARCALTQAARETDTGGFDLVVVTGSVFAHNNDWSALALLALDGLQPQGIFTLAVDGLGMASAFGGLISIDAPAAAQVIEHDSFITLGTVIAPVSGNSNGQIDARIKLKSTSGELRIEVRHGSLELIPLAPGEQAHIEVKLVGDTQLDQARRGVFKADVEGGMLGLIIDARGRPLTEPTRDQIRRWYRDLGIDLTSENENG